MSLVGQYDMDLFTSIFSLLFMPVPGFHLDGLPPVEVGVSPPVIAVNCSQACVLLSIAKPVTKCLSQYRSMALTFAWLQRRTAACSIGVCEISYHAGVA